MKELICITCPRGCRLTVDENLNVSGNFCPRGAKYAISELTKPVRVLTSTVRTSSDEYPRCPVKSNSPLPKGKMFDAMKLIDKVVITLPVKIGDVIIKNIFDSDIDIVATKNLDK
jgi:CxxC motif-containing protein